MSQHAPHRDADALLEEIVPPGERRRAGVPWVEAGIVLAVVAGVVAAWMWTPLGELFDIQRLVGWVRPLRESPLGLAVALAAFVVGGLVAAPVTALIVAAGLAFGLVRGLLYATAGVLASAAVTWWIGRRISRDLVRRLSRGHLDALGARLGAGGVLAVAGIRFVPVAPFSVVNLVAGAARVRFRDFLLGTFVGMVPIVIGLAGFGGSLLETLTSAEPLGSLVMFALALALLGFGTWIRRHLRRANARREMAEEARRTRSPA